MSPPPPPSSPLPDGQADNGGRRAGAACAHVRASPRSPNKSCQTSMAVPGVVIIIITIHHLCIIIIRIYTGSPEEVGVDRRGEEAGQNREPTRGGRVSPECAAHENPMMKARDKRKTRNRRKAPGITASADLSSCPRSRACCSRRAPAPRCLRRRRGRGSEVRRTGRCPRRGPPWRRRKSTWR